MDLLAPWGGRIFLRKSFEVREGGRGSLNFPIVLDKPGLKNALSKMEGEHYVPSNKTFPARERGKIMGGGERRSRREKDIVEKRRRGPESQERRTKAKGNREGKALRDKGEGGSFSTGVSVKGQGKGNCWHQWLKKKEGS